MDKLCDTLKENVLQRMDFSKEATEQEVRSLIAEEISKCITKEKLSIKQRVYLEKRVFHALRGLDILQELLEDDSVTEIMVNGPKQVFFEKNGKIEKYAYSFSSEERLQDVIQQIVGRHNRVINRMNPIADTRLEDGSRVNIVLAPIAIDGSAISIRKFPKEALTMEKLVECDTLTWEAMDFLRKVVKAGYNLFISGGTSSGKTTFLNALSAYIPLQERVITIEDSAERHPVPVLGIDYRVKIIYKNINVDERKLFMRRDSFGSAMIKVLASQFNESFMLHSNSFNDNEIVREQKPDIFVYEVVERYIRELLHFKYE